MKKLYRSQKHKVLAGVCGGIGDYFDIDPVIIRILAIVSFFSGGLFAYIIAIFIIPLQPETTQIEEQKKPDIEKAPEKKEKQTTQSKNRPGLEMEKHITILGILYITFSCLFIFAAIIVFIFVAGSGWVSGDDTALTITTIIGSTISAFLILISLPGIIGGIAILNHQPWARILLLILGIINLINIPFGTILGIYTIWVLVNDETEQILKA